MSSPLKSLLSMKHLSPARKPGSMGNPGFSWIPALGLPLGCCPWVAPSREKHGGLLQPGGFHTGRAQGASSTPKYTCDLLIRTSFRARFLLTKEPYSKSFYNNWNCFLQSHQKALIKAWALYWILYNGSKLTSPWTLFVVCLLCVRSCGRLWKWGLVKWPCLEGTLGVLLVIKKSPEPGHCSPGRVRSAQSQCRDRSIRRCRHRHPRSTSHPKLTAWKRTETKHTHT